MGMVGWCKDNSVGAAALRRSSYRFFGRFFAGLLGFLAIRQPFGSLGAVPLHSRHPTCTHNARHVSGTSWRNNALARHKGKKE
jgi:hypothetical protein